MSGLFAAAFGTTFALLWCTKKLCKPSIRAIDAARLLTKRCAVVAYAQKWTALGLTVRSATAVSKGGPKVNVAGLCLGGEASHLALHQCLRLGGRLRLDK